MKKGNLFTILSFAAMLGLTAVMLVDLLPLLKEVITNAKDETSVVEYMSTYGPKGIPILIGLQALQVILAVIPSAAIQILTGLCYGIWWGTLINMIGCALGNTLVFSAMRQLKVIAAPLSEKMSRNKGWSGAEKLIQLKKPEIAATLLFLIPGVPNGIMPYLFAKTKITLPRYLLALVIGSIPSTFLCTLLGDRLSKGNYITAIVLAVIVVLTVGMVALFWKQILKKLESAEKS